MNNPAQTVAAEGADDQALVQYLQQNPDFFERHPQLLTRMRLQHPRNGTTISLIERQVELLRSKHAALEQQLADFVRVARANDSLSGKIHRFAIGLLHTTTATAALALVEKGLREDFDTHYGALILQQGVAQNISHAVGQPGGGDVSASERVAQFVRVVPAEDANFRSFDSLFAGGKPRCGQVRDSQRDFLFGADAVNIGSVALVPLTELAQPGLLALGSVDKERFHPGMSVDFLARMGSLIAAAITRS